MKRLVSFVWVVALIGCSSQKTETNVTRAEKVPMVKESVAPPEAIENARMKSVVPRGWRGFDLAQPGTTSADKVGEKAHQLANALRESQVVSFFALPESGFEPGTNIIWIAVDEAGGLEDARKMLLKDLPSKPILNEIRENPKRLVLVYEVAADSSDGVKRQQLTYQSIVKKGANTVTVTLVGDAKDREELMAVGEQISRSTVAK